MNDELLTPAEVAELVKVSTQTIKRWFHRGKIAAIMLPNDQLRFRREDIEALMTPQVMTSFPSANSADALAQTEL